MNEIINVLGHLTFLVLIVAVTAEVVVYIGVFFSFLWSKGASYTDYLTHRKDFKRWLRRGGNQE